MNKLSEDTLKKIASTIVDAIEENVSVGGISSVGPAQAGSSFGSLGGIGSSGTGTPTPNGVGNAQAKPGTETKTNSSASANSQGQKNEYGKLPKQASQQVMAIVNKVNHPMGRKGAGVGDVNPVSVTVKGTIDHIGKG